MIKTEWFETVTNEDLQVTEGYNSMILYCWKCRCFSRMKACGMRTIFPSTRIYHPTDGNVVIMEDDSIRGRLRTTSECTCKNERMKTVNALEDAIAHYSYGP